MNRYIAISGYIGNAGRDEFSKIWLRNLDKNEDFHPEKIFVLCSRGERPPIHCGITDFVVCKGDLGHIHWPNHKHQIEGWPVALIAGLMVAYNCECDAIFVEQDCLPFGPFVTRMYSEIRDGVGIIMGKLSNQPCAQGLMLIRHWMIPELAAGFLNRKIKDKNVTGEDAFAQMENEQPHKFQRFSFGYDRDRPFNVKDPVFYIQQVTTDELTSLKDAGLLDLT